MFIRNFTQMLQLFSWTSGWEFGKNFDNHLEKNKASPVGL